MIARLSNSTVNFCPGDTMLYERSLLCGKLPESARHLRNSLDWPINMDRSTRIFNYNEQPQIRRLGSRHYPHLGIDLQCRAGKEVRACEGGRVTYCELDNRFDKTLAIDTEHGPRLVTKPILDAKGRAISNEPPIRQITDNTMADIYIESDASGLIWVYRHLKANSIPYYILSKTSVDKNSSTYIENSSYIGEVAKWQAPLKIDELLPASYVRSNGRNIDHLHLEAHGESRTGKLGYSVNPTLLLKRLPIPMKNLVA